MDFAFIHNSPFYELTALLVCAALVGFVGSLLRQPLVVCFMVVGVVVGPVGLDLVQSHENINLLAELGIVLLLFLVGLKLDFNLIRRLGTVALATGLGQVAFTSIIGFFIGLGLGLDMMNSFYVAIALTFSSTIIIVKLLTDKKEVDSLHGRISIGLLIVQDVVVIFAMLVLSAMVGFGVNSGNQSLDLMGQVGSMLVGVTIFVTSLVIFVRYLAIPLVGQSARSSELLIIFAIAWASLLASIGHSIGFSKELGGLLAGISLASTPFREAIASRLSSLRDFLLLFFFISLGSNLNLGLLGEQIIPAIIFSFFVLIGNPLVVMFIMGVMGYRKRTGFMVGLTVAQISEFSLIFIAMGVKLRHIHSESLGLVTLVGLITIALSVYMITYSNSLYLFLEPLLGIFERQSAASERDDEIDLSKQGKYDVVIFGLGVHGKTLAKQFLKEGWRFLGVDFNPNHVHRLQKYGYNAIYGDACDQEFINMISFDRVKWVICALPHHEFGLTHEDPRHVLIDALKAQNYKGKVAICRQRPDDDFSLFDDKRLNIIILPLDEVADLSFKRMNEMSLDKGQGIPFEQDTVL